MKYTELPKLVQQRIVDRVADKVQDRYVDEVLEQSDFEGKFGVTFEDLHASDRAKVVASVRERFDKDRVFYIEQALKVLAQNDKMEGLYPDYIPINFDIERISEEVYNIFGI